LHQQQAGDRHGALEGLGAAGGLGGGAGELQGAHGRLGVGRAESGAKLSLEGGEVGGG
jgi:hypothetical protein